MNRSRNVSLFFIPLLMLLLVFTINTSAATKENINSNLQGLDEHQIELLKEKGFSEQLIENYMRSGDTFSDLMKMEVAKQDVKHYRVTSPIPKSNFEIPRIYSDEKEPETIVEEITYEELQQELSNVSISVMDSDYSITTHKTMTVTMTRINKDRYRVSNFVEWHRAPWHTKIDIIGIGLNQNTSPIPGTESGYQDAFEGWIHKGTINYGSINSGWNRDGDYGLRVDLMPDGALNPSWIYDIYMQYDIRPNVDNLTYYDAYAHYAHQERTLQVTPSFSISSGVLSIETKYSKNFTIHKPQPHVQMRRY